MKVLMINGSPRIDGNTALALKEMEAIFAAEGMEYETVWVGTQPIRGCIACGGCYKLGKCVFDDAVNEVAEKIPGCGRSGGSQPCVLCFRQRHPHFPAGPAVLQQQFPQNHEGRRQRGRCPPGWLLRHLRPAEQVFHHQRHARGLQPILEQCPRRPSRRSQPGRRGSADHAHSGTEYGIPHEIHRPRQGALRPAGTGKTLRHQFHPVIPSPRGKLFIDI